MKRNTLAQLVMFALGVSSFHRMGMTQQDPAAVKKALEPNWLGLETEVSKKVAVVGGGNEYSKVGDIIIPVPTLAAFGINAEIDEAATKEAEDGLPVYKDENLNWLFGSAVAACKAQARNKLISGTADLKEGQKIAENFAELTAEGERKGNAEALKLQKEIVQSFGAWVQGLGKSAQTQAVLVGLFRNKQALALQTDDNKNKMKGYLGQYAETLEQKDLERYGKYLTSVEEACKGGIPQDF